MQRPGTLQRALTWAYLLLGVAYATVGAVGYALYGTHSHELLLIDMGPSGGQRVSHFTRVLLNIMLAALTMKAPTCTYESHTDAHARTGTHAHRWRPHVCYMRGYAHYAGAVRRARRAARDG